MDTRYKTQDTRWTRWLSMAQHVSCVLCLVSLFFCGQLRAEDISFEATIDANKVPMGTAAQLTLTVRGTQDVNAVTLPALDGFEARYVGPSTQVSVVNGAYSTAKSFTYILLPLKEGTFTIPPLELQIKGQTFRTEPITMQVIPASAGATADQSGGVSEPVTTESLKDKILFAASLPRTQCYVNEQVPVVFKLYVNELSMQDVTLPDVKPDGFLLSSFDQPKQYTQALNGRQFQVVEFTARLTPTRTGTLTVGPAVIGGNILYKTNVQRNPFGSSVFDDGFFANFFGGVQKKGVTVTSVPLQLSVQDVPVDGKPAGFSGAVGQFNFEASVSPSEIKVGDPVTLRMAVAGLGDLKTISLPTFRDERFKTYDPKILDESGKKSLEQVIIPTKEDIQSVPALNFSFFDTSSGQYRTITQGPFPIRVSPPAKGEEFQAVAFAGKPLAAEETLGKGFVFIKDDATSLARKGNIFREEILFYGMLFLYLNVWGVALAFFLYRRKLSTDPGFAKRMSAYREATLALKEAKARMEAGDTKGFYDTLVSALRAYLFRKLALPPGEAEGRAMADILHRHGVDAKKVKLLEDILIQADEVRFASSKVPVEKIQQHFLDAGEILDAAERRLK
jgi:hypothetical protein